MYVWTHVHAHTDDGQATAELLTTYAYSWKEGDDACLCYAMDTGAFCLPVCLSLRHPSPLSFACLSACVYVCRTPNQLPHYHTHIHVYKTGAEIRIPLPPGKSAADEAQALYARVRKLRRSVDAVKPLLEKVGGTRGGCLFVCECVGGCCVWKGGGGTNVCVYMYVLASDQTRTYIHNMQVEVKIAYVEELEASLLQLANGAGGAAASSPSTTAAATTTAPATDEIGERGDWSVLVSQDLAVMR